MEPPAELKLLFCPACGNYTLPIYPSDTEPGTFSCNGQHPHAPHAMTDLVVVNYRRWNG